VIDTRVCGVDPGLNTTGYAVLRVTGGALSVLDAGVCRFDAKLPLEKRLMLIESDLSAVFAEYRPELVAVEQLYAHYKHPRTGILMGHARGVILLTAAKLGSRVESFAATQIKRYLTGNGRASKRQVQAAIKRLLNLDAIPEPPDLADAIAIALCAAGGLRNPHFTEAVFS